MSPMTAEQPLDAEGHPSEGAFLEEAFLALETPPGYRAELIEAEIVVTPPPSGDHEDCLDTVVRQVLFQSATSMSASGHKGLVLPSGQGGGRRSHLIPDATFAPRELRLFRGAPSWMRPAGVAMVVEITSSNPQRDREDKRRCYARGAIPHYLLVDRETGTVTLYGDPTPASAPADYQSVFAVPFGKSVPLPEPFGFELDTSELP